MPEFDARDYEILETLIEAWNAKSGPRVGDFVIFPDGEFRRFTHDHGDELQTTVKREAGHYNASFFLGHGYMSFSGSLDPAIKKDRLLPTIVTRDGSAWFFHHNHVAAHNGVHCTVPCRVFTLAAK